MKENFEKSLSFTLDPSIEGGFANHIKDRGGPTNQGITLKTLKAYYADYGYGDFDMDGDADIDDLLLLDTPEEAAPIYRKWFWDGVRGDDLPSGVDYVIFDSAVNHWVINAGIFLQRALNRWGQNLEVDGIIGPVTIKAVAEYGSSMFITDILRERDTFYRKIVARDLSQEVFMKGWLNRLAQVAVNARTFL